MFTVNSRLQVTTLLVHKEWGNNNVKVSCCSKRARVHGDMRLVFTENQCDCQ